MKVKVKSAVEPVDYLEKVMLPRETKSEPDWVELCLLPKKEPDYVALCMLPKKNEDDYLEKCLLPNMKVKRKIEEEIDYLKLTQLPNVN